MANALTSVFAARNRKNIVIVDEGFNTNKAAAEAFAAEMRIAHHKPCVVKLSSYKIGPRKSPTTCWQVRVYQPK